MTDLMVFNNPEFGAIRTVEIDGEAWLVGNDVARALGYKNPRGALIKHVDEEDVAIRDTLDNRGVMQPTKVINESGMYALVILSELPGAKKFKRWVTSEVLPSIRKHGGYSLPQLTTNEMILQLATNAVELERKVQQIEGKLDNAIKIFAKPGTNWKDSMEMTIREMAGDGGWELIKAKGKLYQELEVIANVDIQSRLTRKRNRMKKQGATRRDYMAITKLDIISYDKQLRPIFEGIIRKYQAMYAQDN